MERFAAPESGADASPTNNVLSLRGRLITHAIQQRAIARATEGGLRVKTQTVISAYADLTEENKQIAAAIGDSSQVTMGIEGIITDDPA